MIRVSVMYPSGDGKTFDHDYYVQKHMPLVHARWGGMGLVRTEVDRGLAGGAPNVSAIKAEAGAMLRAAAAKLGH